MPEQFSHDPSEQEPAEGSRETVNANVDDPAARQRFQEAQTGTQPGNDSGSQGGKKGPAEADADSGGITNRPMDQEIENQRDLPPRGQAKDKGSHA